MTFKLASLPLARDVSVQLASAEMTGSQVFQGTYISYAHLADMLKNFESSFRGMPTFDQEAMKKHFLSCLQADVLRVARTFDKVAGSLIKAGTGARRWWSRQVGGWAAKVKNPSLPSAASNPKLLRKLARECLEYAEMNKQVLRALVSQYEGHFGTGEAAAFLDKCWDPSSDDCLSFLVSPLKEDLEAVCLDEPLVRSAARLPALCLSPPLAMGAEMANDDDEISDNDLLQCPICYEVKYKPVALACGHSFCRLCVLDAAKLTTTIASSFAVKMRIADLHHHATCPMCKRTGVYSNATELKAIDTLASARYPKAYQQKRREEQHRERIVLHAFIHKQQLVMTPNGLALGKEHSPGAWTHRVMEDRTPQRRGQRSR
uniref:RING-type domain-containing protein n=1 Tax=Tetraselmis sp. GSL018 TaxID=582737 RepID=A0A061RJ93_9CHLO|mmetsp:Transcript_1848/g.4379  ORF Transcript_1848/g.4379 Transcript_1848/m.4379 type:complete len:375 (+) Transcript_1848:161-1285(+)